MISAGIDYLTKESELLSLLRREMNGAVVDSMREKGLEYKQSYGVSLVDIKAISRNFAPDHGLAKYIYAKDFRELRLSAFHIADPQSLKLEEIPFWATGITTTEIASVGALALFSKGPLASEFIFTFFGSALPILQYAAIMTAAANLMHTKNNPDWNPTELLKLIKKDKAANPEKWPGYLDDALHTLQLRLDL